MIIFTIVGLTLSAIIVFLVISAAVDEFVTYLKTDAYARTRVGVLEEDNAKLFAVIDELNQYSKDLRYEIVRVELVCDRLREDLNNVSQTRKFSE